MSSITMRDIRAFQARYHRNGISGEGFYACRFMLRDGRKLIPMTAVVWDRNDSPLDIRCAVLSLTDSGSPDIDEKWRGDDFAPALRQCINAVRENQPDKLYGYPADRQAATVITLR